MTLIRREVKTFSIHFLLLLMSMKFDNIFTSYVINRWHHSSLSFIKDNESLNLIPCLESEVRWGNWNEEIYKPPLSHLSWKDLLIKNPLYVTAQYELKFLNPKKRPEEALGSLSSFTTTHFSKGSWPNVVSNVKRIN